jgi:hypothetical protein
MTLAELATKYPRVFHMAEPGSWSSIRKHGLLSTAALLALFEIRQPLRSELLSRRRADSVELTHSRYGRAVLRDQKPLSETKLAACLRDGLTPRKWIRLLNHMVFFWVDPRRLAALRAARAYRNARQLVITVDTAQLVARHGDRIRLSDRNTGTTSPMAHPRGADTFVPIGLNGSRRIVELAVEVSVPDVKELVVLVEEVGGGQANRVLFRRERAEEDCGSQ